MMDNILTFLEGIHHNDTKEWFFANRRAYIEAFSKNAENAQKLAKLIGKYDPAIGYLRLADCSFPLPRHYKLKHSDRTYNDYFGGFFARGGKRSGYAGYYYHIAAEGSTCGDSLLAVGIFNPSREVLEWFREEAVKDGSTIMELIKASGFQLLERDRFLRLPKGMTIDEEHRELLLQRHIMLVKRVGTKWFLREDWLERTARTFKRCKPFIDYVNAIIDEHRLGIKRENKGND